MAQEKIGGEMVFQFIRPPWTWELDSLEREIAPTILRGQKFSRPNENTEKALLRAMTHSVMRGLYHISMRGYPYDVDQRLKALLREYPSGPMDILDDVGASVKKQPWTTLFSVDADASQRFIECLIPTFEMSVKRTAKQISLSDFFELDWDDENDSTLDYRSAGLLIIDGIDPRFPLYKRRAAQIISALRKRAQHWTSTLFVVDMDQSLLRKLDGDSLKAHFVSLGFPASDPLLRMIIGEETYKFTLSIGKMGLVFNRIKLGEGN